MKYVCEKDMCTGCMACVDVCSTRAIIVHDDIESYNAVIDNELCLGCNLCEKICPQNNPVEKKEPLGWLQGWAKDEIRCRGTSGGFTTAIMLSFLKNGGMVCACQCVNGEYIYKLTDKEYDIWRYTGSKYVKSNPTGAYKSIETCLSMGKRILFVGLPCHVAALKKYIKNAINLYTIELICHGTPSPRLLKKYIRETGIISEDIKFRNKECYNNNGYACISSKGVLDYYTLAFLDGLIFTRNCYKCQYAQIERIGDLMLGDSWGSDLPKEEIKKGISLAFYQNTKGKELLDKTELYRFDVDLEKAKRFNHQLNEPTKKPKQRKIFFNMINKNRKFKTALKRALPKEYFKRNVKSMLIKLRIKKPTDMPYGIWVKNN